MYKLTDLYKQIKEEETSSSPQYKIYCDMDGVLVDFDKGYDQLTGKPTHHVDVQGKQEFWDTFKQGLANKKMSEKDYWANLEWTSISLMCRFLLSNPFSMTPIPRIHVL